MLTMRGQKICWHFMKYGPLLGGHMESRQVASEDEEAGSGDGSLIIIEIK